jgi:hypothetical protein
MIEDAGSGVKSKASTRFIGNIEKLPHGSGLGKKVISPI